MVNHNEMLLKFEELTAPQINILCKDNRVLLLSFGSIEQHSTHLPVGTDYLCMIKRVEEIARRTKGVLFSPLQLGYSFNHTGMQGTISLDARIFIDIVHSILIQLFEQGWKRVLIFSGHNGNWPSIRVAVQAAREKHHHAQVVLAEGYPRMSDEHRKGRFIRHFDYHAGLTETAIVSCLANNLVDEASIPGSNSDIPEVIKRIMSKPDLDDIDLMLMGAVIPQHTEDVSKNGMWGSNDPSLFKNVPVKKAMEAYIDYYVQLIRRWDELR